MGTAPTSKTYNVTWLRTEYRGREAELVSGAEVASIARVDRYTVTSWIKRYGHFPDPVKEVRTGRGPTRYFVTREVVRWLIDERPRADAREDEPHQLRIVLAEYDAEIGQMRQRLAHLESVADQIRNTVETGDTMP